MLLQENRILEAVVLLFTLMLLGCPDEEAPDDSSPSPSVTWSPTVSPTPAETSPTPSAGTPTPLEVSPTPAEATPTQVSDTPTPAEASPTPEVISPTPAGITPTPLEDSPTPMEESPTPATPTPGEETPTPTPSLVTPTPFEPTPFEPTPFEPTPTPPAATPTPTMATPTPTPATPTPGIDADDDGFTIAGGDCNDGDPAINPGASEQCNGLDDDCDATVDEGVMYTHHPDNDGDGAYDPGTTIATCSSTPPCGDFEPCPEDCDDSDPSIYEGAPERCDGKDNDCNGEADEGFDDDGLGGPDCIDDDGDGYSEDDGDCDDEDSSFYPEATEVCNGGDDNCDGEVDEGFDGDGIGGPDCTDNDGDGYSEDDGDCDDEDSNISPDAAETCDSVDDDCDGEIDEGFDADGLGGPDCQDGDGDGVTELEGDCNDEDPSVYAGAAEIPGDGLDQNCRGLYLDPLAISGNAPAGDVADGSLLIGNLGPDPLDYSLAVAYEPYWNNGALRVDGADDNVYVANGMGIIDGEGDYSLEFWIWLQGYQGSTAPNEGTRVLYRTGYPNTAWWVIDVRPDGRVEFEKCAGSNTSGKTGTTVSEGSLPLQTWTHVAIVMDRTAMTDSYYFNGELDSVVSHPAGFVGSMTSSSAQTFGIPGTWNRMTGYLDEVKLWARALDQAEVQSRLYSPTPSEAEGLEAYWPFDSGFFDASHNGHDGSPQGGVGVQPVDRTAPFVVLPATEDSIAPEKSVRLELFLDTLGLAPGTYAATLTVSSSDEEEGPVALPVTLVVE